MDLIKLTLSNDGRPVLINPDHIVAITYGKESKQSIISLTVSKAEHALGVTETPEEIQQLITNKEVRTNGI